MKSKLAVTLFLIIGLAMVASPLSAHHGGVAYDAKNPVTLKGTVTEFVWQNPHVQIYMDVVDDKGNTKRWSCEAFSPGKLVRAGWSKNVVKPGDQITVTVSPAKSGNPIGALKLLVLANGQEFRPAAEEIPQF